jgi:hypothetical protein
MAVYISKKFLDKLNRVEKQESWTVRELSEILGMPTRTICGKIKRKEFSVVIDIGSRKVLSKSVVEFYKNRFKKLDERIKDKAWERINKAAIVLHRELDKLLKCSDEEVIIDDAE